MPPVPEAPADLSNHAAVVGWLLVVLVVGLVAAFPIALKLGREERERMLAAHETNMGKMLEAFRESIRELRESHERQVASIRTDHGSAHDRLHDRLDGIDRSLTELSARTRP